MPKFRVLLGRLVRETVEITVEASSQKEVEDRMKEVYEDYDGCDWEPDDEWGCEPSDSHVVVGLAEKTEEPDIILYKESEENDE